MVAHNPTKAPLGQQNSTSIPESTREHVLALIQTYASKPIDDSPYVAADTQKERDRLWGIWTKFCSDYQIDYRAAWINFLEHPESAPAQAPFRSFLHIYIETTVRWCVVLDSREWEHRRMVQSAFTLTEVWRRLVASADYHVMREKRRNEKDPYRKDIWKLRWKSEEVVQREGPTYLIVKWIHTELSVKLGLVTVPEYEKREMTSADVIVALQTLWSRPADIRCKRITRVSFHAIVLLAAIGGFRPGTLMNLEYSQFKVAVLRDPRDPTKKKIVITARINRNKIKEASKTTRRRQVPYIDFSLTLVPNSTTCLGSKILTRAIQDDAFDAGYKTIDEMLDRPHLEEKGLTPLTWKTSVLHKHVFPISYNILSRIWHCTLQAAGFRTHLRFYSLRVGAGARLDGVLSDCLRNYVMSHTTDVFEANYQAVHVRADLVSLAFKKGAGEPNDPIFDSLRDASLSRDAGAPVKISLEDQAMFEQRNDVTGLRAEIAKALGMEKARLQALVGKIRKPWNKLMLQRRRDEYFERVDSLRARGLPTTEHRSPADRSTTLDAAEAGIARFLEDCAAYPTAHCDTRSRAYMRSLLGYLTNAPVASTENHETEGSKNPNGATGELRKKLPHCLICRGKDPYSNRSALTRHYKAQHTMDTTFSRPFSCPECCSLGLVEFIVASPWEWSNHVETTHGKINAPNLVPQQLPSKPSCSVCPTQVLTTTQLLRHTNAHIKAGFSEWPTTCFGCSRSGLADVPLASTWEWLDHFKACHLPTSSLCILCGYICSNPSGLTRHMSSAHSEKFQCPFFCPACRRQDANHLNLIDGLASWQLHLAKAHDEGDQKMRSWDEPADVGAKRKREEEEEEEEDGVWGTETAAGQSAGGGRERKKTRYDTQGQAGPGVTILSRNTSTYAPSTMDITTLTGPGKFPMSTASSLRLSDVEEAIGTEGFAAGSTRHEDVSSSANISPGNSGLISADFMMEELVSSAKSACAPSTLHLNTPTSPCRYPLSDLHDVEEGGGVETDGSVWHCGECIPGPLSAGFSASTPVEFPLVDTEAPPRHEDGLPSREPRSIPRSLIDPKLLSQEVRPDPGISSARTESVNVAECPSTSGVELLGVTPSDLALDRQEDTLVSTEDTEYTVDCLLERWRKDEFLLKWSDRSCWWVPRWNIGEELVESFEANYNGLRLGVEVLATRKRNGKMQYQVHWVGRPDSEDSWVHEKDMSPELIAEHRPMNKKRRRRRH